MRCVFYFKKLSYIYTVKAKSFRSIFFVIEILKSFFVKKSESFPIKLQVHMIPSTTKATFNQLNYVFYNAISSSKILKNFYILREKINFFSDPTM